MNTRQRIAKAESQENLIKRLLKKNGLDARQGGQGPKENRTECDIHLVDHAVAIEVQFADSTKKKNENFSIGKDKLSKINPNGREAYLLFGNENSARYTIVHHVDLRNEADEVTAGHAEYVGLQDKGAWYLIYPEYLSEICVCEADTLEGLIERFAGLEMFRHAEVPSASPAPGACLFQEGSCKAADCPEHGWTDTAKWHRDMANGVDK